MIETLWHVTVSNDNHEITASPATGTASNDGDRCWLILAKNGAEAIAKVIDCLEGEHDDAA